MRILPDEKLNRMVRKEYTAGEKYLRSLQVSASRLDQYGRRADTA